MFVTLGWVLLAGLPLSSFLSIDNANHPPARRSAVAAAGRVAVWTEQDDPYRRGQGARVYLDADEPATSRSSGWTPTARLTGALSPGALGRYLRARGPGVRGDRRPRGPLVHRG